MLKKINQVVESFKQVSKRFYNLKLQLKKTTEIMLKKRLDNERYNYQDFQDKIKDRLGK